MRTLTTNAQNKTTQRLASEPILILEINWSSGTLYYGDKTTTISGTPVSGKVLDFSPIQASGKQDTSGEVSSANVTLDDVDGTLKVIYNTLIIPGTLVTAYHHYEGNAWTDKTLVFKGKVNGSVEWDEGARTLKFDIESYIDDVEVGYAPEEGEIVGQNPDTYGVMWPIVFGGVKRLKAIAVKTGTIGNTTEGIIGGWPAYDSIPFEVEGGDKYAQNVPMDIVVNTTRFHGYFQGNKFYRDNSNMTWYENVPLAERDSGDPDVGSNKVCWIAPGYNIAKKNGWLGEGKQFNYCTKQEGNKCYFQYEWNHLPDETESFAEVRGCAHNTWYASGSWLNYWYIKPNGQVYKYNESASDFYVVNQYPSVQVVEVYAWRTYDGSKIFVPVPSSYYTIHLSYAIGGQNATVIEFPKPLTQYDGEDWESDIYVSLRSTLSSNTSAAIKWLIQTYTGYSIDTASFDSVLVDLAPYPANFAILSKQNVLALIEDIAWQARCALYTHNGTISIKYLSKDLPSVYSVTPTDILLKSLKLLFTPVEDVYTKLTGTWRLDYTDEKDKTKKLIYTNNVAQFGLRELEKDIYIYNIEELAKMTVYFWGYRYSNSWRIAQYPTVLRTLALELFDCVNHAISILSTNTIRGILQDVSHDSANNEIALEAQLASKAGQHSGGQPVEDPNYWTGDPLYPVMPRSIVDPLSGLTITNYTVPTTPTGGGTSGTGGGTGGGGGGTATTTYKYVFILPTQDEIERGVNFAVKIQLQTSLGVRQYNTVDAKLSLHCEDFGDRLSGGVLEKNIQLQNGEYYVTNEQINGGNTVQEGAYLSCVDALDRNDYAPGTSEPFKVIGVKTGVLSWSTNPPGNVQRGTNFPVVVTGGVSGQIIDVIYNKTDTLDKVYSSGSQITTITFGIGGTYNGTWQIVGGAGAEAANSFTLHDSRYNTYANTNSTNFGINGAGQSIVKSLVQALVVSQNLVVNAMQLEVTFVSGTLRDDTDFTLRFKLLDSDGNVIDFDDPVTIKAYDAAGNLMNWLYPLAIQEFTMPMTDGVSEDLYRISIPEGTLGPITFYGEVTYNGEIVQGQLDQAIGAAPSFTVTAPPSITRGTPFNIIVQAMDVDVPITTYVPTSNLDIIVTSPSLNGELPTPAIIDNTGWANGSKTVSVTINGGSGSKILTVTVEEP